MATFKRCKAQLSLVGSWGSERLQAGMDVDMDRELEPGFTVGDAVRGREDCFEPADETEQAPERALEQAAPERAPEE